MKISFFNSIKVRIIIAVIIMVSVPFAILQSVNKILIYNKLQLKTAYTTEALSRLIATNVSEFIQGAHDASNMLSRNNYIINNEKDGKSTLEAAIKTMPYFRLFYAQDMEGMQTLRSSGELGNRSDRWWFKKVKADQNAFVSEAYLSVNNNELVSSIYLPLLKDNKMVGVFGADFTLNTIESIANKLLDRDISYIVMDNKGSVLTSTDSKPGEYINYIDFTKRTVALDKNNNYKLDASGQLVTSVENIKISDTMKRIISGALDKKTESYQFKDTYNNIVVAAYQPIQLPGNSEPWSVIVFQKQTDKLTLNLLAIIFIFLLLCSILITFKLININVIKPIIELQHDMEKIAEGKLDITVDTSSKNEIGELAGNINKMVTSLKYHQQTLDENEKMVALGSLVAGVAHEINTPLGIGVTTSSYMQKINYESRKALVEGIFSKKDLVNYMEDMDESLELLQYNLERASEIIKSFKRIAVDQTIESIEEFNVAEYIHSIVVSLRHEYKKHNHSFNVQCDKELSITSYPGILAHILTNFIMNSIIHGFAEIENGKIDIIIFKDKNMFNLQYSDNGCGISEENIKKIFTPFFTTKKHIGGSGLGLSIVYNLVTKKLYGSISVTSKIGKGTTFIISIPI
ncbi:ATP-binding protein [Clostridium sp.]|uniref:ATP-binding protein n=1 Tax=Clostridium sp. TaxID=1506 RepID=UPI001A52B500|nr:ATP-binding protein [Clostridium sp.]MBK5236718.1 sensor histidine kinase [Clostridium sp.]